MLVGAGLDPGQRFPRIGVRFADGRTAGREATFRGHLDVGKDDGGIPTEPILTITGGGGCHRAALRHARSATQRASDHRNAAFGSLTRGSLTRRWRAVATWLRGRALGDAVPYARVGRVSADSGGRSQAAGWRWPPIPPRPTSGEC